MKKITRNIHQWLTNNLLFAIALLFVISLPFSESLLSISAGLIALQILYPVNIQSKIKKLKHDNALWALSLVFLFYFVACIFTNDKATSLYELKKNIFWLIIPFGMALAPRLSSKQFWIILFVFVSVVTVSSFYTTLNLLFPAINNIKDLRDASLVSHVSLALLTVFSIFILFHSYLTKAPFFNQIKFPLIVLWVLWLAVFLTFQKSLTGIIAMIFSTMVFIVWFIKKAKQIVWQVLGFIVLFLLVIVPVLYVSWVTYDFFQIKDTQANYNLTTESGNRYIFDTDNTLTENGHYVYWYICPAELEEQWNRVSSIKINERDEDGYRVYNTVIRYMTSKGLKKDSAGVASLTTQDIKNIENGMSNHIFYTKRFSIYPRIYQTVWELNRYFSTGNPNNQSVSQRIEYTRAAIYIIQNNFWGIGTGNYKQKYQQAYEHMQSKLDNRFRFMVHNQYLSYIVKFGYTGFVIIIFIIGYVVIYHKQHRNMLLILLLTTIGFAGMGETTLETHIGLSMFLFFLSLFLWHSPNTTKSKKIEN